jgi:hypothetical protein
MTRWFKVATAVLALGGLPAVAADTGAQAKDRAHEAEIDARMKARSDKPGEMSNHERADQAADATRKGEAKAARAYHGAAHSAKKGAHSMSEKAEHATK